jgi:agmatinase
MTTLTVPVPIGRPTFLDAPRVNDLAGLDADVAIIGVPYTVPYGMEGSRQYSSTAPETIREQSLKFVDFLTHYDYDFGGPIFAERDVKVVDCGDVAMEPGQYEANAHRASEAIRAILERGAVPIVLGGDHAVPIPVVRAYEGMGDIYVVQIDAHIDWRHERDGTTEGLSSPMRRASEMSWVRGMAQIGIRGVGSARRQEFDDAWNYGAQIIGAEELHEAGVASVLERIPDDERYYVTFDADGLDPSIAPGVRTRAFGGVTYSEASNILRGLARKGAIAGYDFVEVAPAHDVSDMTSLLAARLTLNLIGAMAHEGQIGTG